MVMGGGTAHWLGSGRVTRNPEVILPIGRARTWLSGGPEVAFDEVAHLGV